MTRYDSKYSQPGSCGAGHSHRRAARALRRSAQVVEAHAYGLAGQVETPMVVSVMSAAAELERLAVKLDYLAPS